MSDTLLTLAQRFHFVKWINNRRRNQKLFLMKLSRVPINANVTIQMRFLPLLRLGNRIGQTRRSSKRSRQ